MPEKIREIYCRNIICKQFLCRSNGELLFVENLEVMPKVSNKRRMKGSILVEIICPECGLGTNVGVKATPAADGNSSEAKPGRKFLIFHSRFSLNS